MKILSSKISIFIVPCPNGFTKLQGRVPGIGIGINIPNSTLDECATQCTNQSGCNSFESWDTGRSKKAKCKLLEEKMPTQADFNRTYFYCSNGI